MTTYLALLRGINVGGHRVKMERMRELFRELGFSNVRSYIQSGNLFFETPETDRSTITAQIEHHLRAALGYDVPTFLRTVTEMEGIVRLDPFSSVEITPETRLLIVFTSQPLKCEHPLPLRSPDGDIEILGVAPGEVFVAYRVHDGKQSDVSRFLKQALGSGANSTTARFYGTTLKMLEFGKREAA